MSIERKLYIRKGEHNSDGLSTIHEYNNFVGYEKGLSVYDCHYDKDQDRYSIVLPTLITPTTLNTLTYLITYFVDGGEWIVYEGVEVGKGTDGEPLIADFKILHRLHPNYFLNKP